MLVSERIFELLQEKGMSQKEFSDQTGISQSTISDWKRKKTNPTVDKIMLICNVLAVSPYELLSGVENENYKQLNYVIIDKQSEDYLFLEHFRQCDPQQKSRILGYMQALSEKK